MSRSRRRAVMLLITLTVFFDELSYSVIVPILPRQAEKFGWNEMEIGLLVGSFGLSGLAMAPFVGRLSNRLGPRRLFFTGLVLLASGAGLCAVGTAYGWVLTGRVLQGVSAVVTSTVGMAYIAKTHPAEQRGGVMGIVTGGFAAGAITGPAVGGALFERVGYSVPFVLISLSVVMLALASAKVLLEGEAPRGGKDSFRTLLARPQVRLLVLCAALSMGVLGMLEAVVPLHLERSFGTGPTIIGLVFFGVTLSQGLTSPLAGVVTDRRGTRFTMLAGLILFATTMIAVSVGGSVPTIAASLCAAGLASAFVLVPILNRMAELGDASDETSYSTAYALLNFALDTGTMVGPLLGGVLLGTLDFTLAILSASAILFAGAWLSYSARSSDRKHAQEPPEASRQENEGFATGSRQPLLEGHPPLAENAASNGGMERSAELASDAPAAPYLGKHALPLRRELSRIIRIRLWLILSVVVWVVGATVAFSLILLPSAYVADALVLNAGVALAVGLVLGVGLAFVLACLDDSQRPPQEQKGESQSETEARSRTQKYGEK